MYKTVTERFLSYIAYDTTSKEDVTTFPSTPNQRIFAEYLVQECKEIGLDTAFVDNNGYVLASIPATIENAPSIGFIAHMDTSPDASGKDIVPIVIENYDGKDITRTGATLSPAEFPELLLYKNETIITSDGTTLLGADDKAGIAEILTAMSYIIEHPEIPHGKICIAFTPDEEVGRGADFFPVEAFSADFAYTLDGGKIGELEYENFNAAQAVFHIKGKSVHPGTAKNIMQNAILIGTQIIHALPEKETPSHTEGYEGFFHICSFTGSVSEATLTYIIRDFDKQNFENRKQLLHEITKNMNQLYPDAVTLTIQDQYQNMKDCIQEHMEIIELAKSSMIACDIAPIIQPIRGGTDGARLCFMGLPCPNIFAGGHNFHGPYEFIPISSMEKAVQLIVEIVKQSITIDFTKKIC